MKILYNFLIFKKFIVLMPFLVKMGCLLFNCRFFLFFG